MPIKLKGSTSGDLTLSAPAVAGTSSLILPTGTQDLSTSNFGAWTAYTPTITATSGTHTSVTASGRYTVVGKTVTVTWIIAVTNKGTATGDIRFSLPFPAVNAGVRFQGTSYETSVVGVSGFANIPVGGSICATRKYDNTTWWVDGYTVNATITYEAA